jgi:hypothetical protein
LVVSGSSKPIQHLRAKWRADMPWEFVRLSPDERTASRWIRDNTPKESLFLADPYFEAFYLTAQRGALVFWKHIPTEAEDFREWHARLVAVNGGREVLLDTVRLDRDGIQQSFNGLTLESAREIAEQYGLNYYYGPYRESWGVDPVFRAGDKAVYKLP